jgi:hypothetical protein
VPNASSGQCAKFWQPGALMKKESPALFEPAEEFNFAAHFSLSEFENINDERVSKSM